MGGLWEFFGYPDPDAKKPSPDTTNESLASATPTESIQNSQDRVVENNPQYVPQPIDNWQGPRLPNGQAFHDLGSRKFRKTNLPNRALRMVQPNEKHRLDLEMIAKRCLEGDISIINLSDMTHMQSQQNFLRRELRHLSEYTGLHVYSLDKEEKMMLVPGKDVVVDSTRHQLGMNGLL